MVTFGTTRPAMTFSGFRPTTRASDSPPIAKLTSNTAPRFKGKETEKERRQALQLLGAALLTLGAAGTAAGGIVLLGGISAPDDTAIGQSISQALGSDTHISPKERKEAAYAFLNTIETWGQEAAGEPPRQADREGLSYIFNKALKQVRSQLSKDQAVKLDQTVQARQDRLDELLKEAAAVKTYADVEKLYIHSIDKLFTDQELPPDDKKELKTFGIKHLQDNQKRPHDDIQAGLGFGVPSLIIALIGYSIIRTTDRKEREREAAIAASPTNIPRFDATA